MAEHIDASQGALLTSDEHKAVHDAGQLWNLLCRIVGQGPTRDGDCGELIAHVHGIQQAVLKQAAARAYPDLYRLLGGVVGGEQSPPPGGVVAVRELMRDGAVRIVERLRIDHVRDWDGKCRNCGYAYPCPTVTLVESVEPWATLARDGAAAAMGLVEARSTGGASEASRTWALPTIAGDVMAVRDDEGVTWRRYGRRRDKWEAPGRDECTGMELLTSRGLLTEVVDGRSEAPGDADGVR